MGLLNRRVRPAETGRTRAFAGFIFSQHTLQRTGFDRDPASLKGEDRAYFIMWNAFALIVETVEMVQQVKWKPWQVDRSDIGTFRDRDKFVEEGVDVLHFIANLLITAGVDDEELSRRFAAKQQLNRERQKSQYAGIGNEFNEPMGDAL